MTALYILLGILLCLFLLLMMRVRVLLAFDDGVRVDLCILFFKFRLYPKKKKKIRVRDYSYKRYRKHLAKRRAKKKEKAGAEEKTKPKLPLRQRISLFVSLFKGIYEPFLRYFRIDVAKLRIDVATGDAAKTAILTGVVSQSVAYLCAILDSHTNVGRTYRAEIAVQPNFLEEHSRAEGKFIFSLRTVRILEIGVRLSYLFLKNKFTQKIETTNTEGE